MKSPYWVFGGDVFPTSRVPLIDPSIKDLLGNADEVFFNLESPVVDVSKCDLFYRNPVKYLLQVFGKELVISCSKSAFIKLNEVINNITWAFSGNHSRDYGDWGINKTFQALSEYKHFGFENDDFYRSYELNGFRFLILNLNLVQPQLLGSSINLHNKTLFRKGPIGLDESIEYIKPLVENYDAIIAYVHMGRCGKRAIQDSDLDRLKKFNSIVNVEDKPLIVVGHHTHEHGDVYYSEDENLLIIGGLGNFIFKEELGKFSESFYYNFLLKLDVQGDSLNVQLVPIYINDNDVVLSDVQEFPDGVDKLTYEIKL